MSNNLFLTVPFPLVLSVSPAFPEEPICIFRPPVPDAASVLSGVRARPDAVSVLFMVRADPDAVSALSAARAGPDAVSVLPAVLAGFDES